MKKLIIVIISAVLGGGLLAGAIYGISRSLSPDPSSPDYSVSAPNEAKGVFVKELFAFSGEYSENGQVKAVNNIAAVKIKNDSPLCFRYAEIKVTTKTQVYTFLATTLLPHEEMTVKEISEKALPRDFEFVSAEMTSWECFEQTPSLLSDSLEISVNNKSLTVKNIGKEDINGEIGIYLKLTDGKSTVSGTTFMAHISPLKKGETKSTSLEIDTKYTLVPVFAEIN